MIELAVRGLPVDRTTSCDSLMNKLIEVACKKPDLHDHLVNCFREQGRIDKLAIL